MTNILIAIALAVVAIGMAYLGFNVTIHPPSSYKSKIIYKSLFWILALTSIGLIIWQTYGNDQTQKHNQQLLNDIQNQSAKINSIINNLKDTIIEKEKEIARISQEQLEVSQKQLSLNYAISVDIWYDAPTKRIIVENRGKTNIYLWGTKTGSGRICIGKNPRVISPKTSYYLFFDHIEKEILQKLGPNAESHIPFEIFITNEKKEKFNVKYLLQVVIVKNSLTIHTQNIGIFKMDWSRQAIPPCEGLN
jgi:hypothetical protein